MSLSVENDRPSLFGAPATEAESYEHYRQLSSAAVVSCLLAACAPLALLDYWALKAIPLCGLAAGLVAWRRIAKHPQEFSGRKAAIIGSAACAFFLVAGTALGVLVPIFEVPADHTRIHYEQLKPAADRPNAAPVEAAALDGRKVFIKGYMFPTPHEKGITRFILCRDNGDCCFGGQPPKSDMILVELVEPLDTEFTTRIRSVAGTFHVAGSRWTDVNQDILYRLEADKIR